MNYLWAGMILIGIIFGAFNGRMEVITNAALDSSKEASGCPVKYIIASTL